MEIKNSNQSPQHGTPGFNNAEGVGRSMNQSYSESLIIDTSLESITMERPSITDRLSLAKDAESVASILHEALSQPELLDSLAQALKSRAEILSSSAPESEVCQTNPINRGMFGHKTTTCAGSDAVPLNCYEPELFGNEYLVKALQYLCGQAATPAVLKNALPNVGLWAQGLYFDSFRAEENKPNEREDFFRNHDGPVDFAELRGKRFVMCAERAPACANVMSVLGFDVLTIVSNCDLGDGPNPHMFNVIATEDKFLILDPTNPVVWRYNNGQRFHTIAAYELSRDKVDEFINGGRISVIHRDMQETTSGKFEASNPVSRVYKGRADRQDQLRQFFADHVDNK